MKALLLKKKKKNSWLENKDMNGSEDSSPVLSFQHFYSRQIPPPWLEDTLRLLCRVLVPAQVQDEIPKNRAGHRQQSPGALKTRQGSCPQLQAPRRHPLQGVLPGLEAGGWGGEGNERRGMAWPWNPFQFHNLYGTPRAALGAKEIL